jgi:hypothetical protein
MERMTLREAAQRTARSITTLRRYIRSGRLNAEKRFGRFGPEYYLSPQDLADAGVEVESNPPATLPVSADPRGARALASAPVHAVAPVVGIPISLYQELQMKHEQLLVQYGMIRAAGVRSMELQRRLEQADLKISRLTDGSSRDDRASTLHTEQLERQLREAHLELEGRALEVAALKEKVRGLEMLTRNAVTTESIEKQFDDVMDQSRRVQGLRSHAAWTAGIPRPADSADSADDA